MVKNRRFEDEPKVSKLGGMRYVQCLLLCLALFVAFTTRVNISVAIVAMTTNDVDTATNGTTNGTTTTSQEHYVWSEKTKSYVLSSFFWGYFTTQIPGGYFAQKYGGKIFLLQAMTVTGILSLLTPFAVSYGNWQWLCAFRLVQGLSQGVLFPTIHTILSKWAPVQERSTLGTYSYMGSKIGTVFTLAISGTLASSPLGWPSIFYLSGILALAWTVAWIIWGASTPRDCRRITAEEQHFIESSLNQKFNKSENQKALKTPWSQILSSTPFLVLVLVHCSTSWGYWTLLTQTPTYIRHVFGVNIKSNALLSSLPYAALIVMGFIFCWINQLLEKHRYSSIQTNRKIFTTISLWIPAVTLIALGYVGAEHLYLAVLILVITMGANSAYMVGWQMNHIDLSPNFAGVLMGITSCSAHLMGLFAPLLVGVVVKDETNPEQWRIIFFVAAAFYFFTNLLYLIFGSAETQSWNEGPTVKDKELNFVKVETKPNECEHQS